MGKFHHLPKRDVAILKRKLSTLQRYLGGIKYMTRLPDIVIVLDQRILPPTSPVSGGANSRYRFQRKGTDQLFSGLGFREGAIENNSVD
ncbi:hypothetical protein ZWY2020_021330 [Hordeum vulgare]|nr:hypothetical protein ZWY2020_021330 [Hordeum vulgare]